MWVNDHWVDWKHHPHFPMLLMAVTPSKTRSPSTSCSGPVWLGSHSPTPALLPHFPLYPLWFNLLHWILSLQLLVFLRCVFSRCSMRLLLPHLWASRITFSLGFCSPYYLALPTAIPSWLSTPSEHLNFNFMFSLSQNAWSLSLSFPAALPHSPYSPLSLFLSHTVIMGVKTNALPSVW